MDRINGFINNINVLSTHYKKHTKALDDAAIKKKSSELLVPNSFVVLTFILMVIRHIWHILHVECLGQPHAVALGLVPLVAGRREVADVNLVGHTVALEVGAQHRRSGERHPGKR